jgi:hypothetical protein
VSSKYSQILDLVEAEVTALVPGVAHVRGRRGQHEHKAPLRIVWVRTGNTAAPAHQGTTLARCRATSVVNLQAYLFAEPDGCEALEHAVIIAAKRVAGPGAIVGGTQWFTPKNMQGTEGAVLSLQFRIPVLEPEVTEADIDEVEIDSTGATAGDGYLEQDEP